MTRLVFRLLGLLILIGTGPTLISAGPVLAQEPNDAIFINGRIYTGDPDLPWATAMAVKNGRVVWVGGRDEAADWAGTDMLRHDLQGKLVLPGLIDAHTHPGYMALTHDILPLPAAATREVLLEGIADTLAMHPERPVIIGMPWGNDLFDPARGPDKGLLDELDNRRPILLWDDWMHSLWVNTAALEAAGVNRNTLDAVPGFSFFQRDADGEPTGYITESEASAFWTKFVDLTPENEGVMLRFLEHLRDQGVTTVFDAGNFGKDEAVFRAILALDRQGKLPVRYHGSYTLFLPADLQHAVSTLKSMRERFASPRLRVDTLKVFFDGVIETRTARMTEDYLDTPGNRGEALLDQAQLSALILDLEREGLHLHLHTVGDGAVKIALDAVEDAREQLGHALSIRVAFSHLEVVRDEDQPRFAELGVIGQFTPAWHGGNEGPHPGIGPLKDKMMRAQPLIDSGARVTFSSDVYFPSDWEDGNANPFVGIQTGHNRQTPAEGPEGSILLPATERLALTDLVAGYTAQGAWQLGVEDEVGRLVPGLKADFIVLDQDLFKANRYEIHRIKPELVVMDGLVVAQPAAR